MRRWLLAAVLAALMVVVSASAAFAGEITGTGKSLEPLHANSICAYSGLNDFPDGSQDGPPGRTQSWGQDVRNGIFSPHDFTPGDACRGGSL